MSMRETYWQMREAWPDFVERNSPQALAMRGRAQIAALRRQCIELDGVKVRMGPHMAGSLKHMVFSGEYEQDERKVVGRMLAADDVVLEIGTGIGLIATLCALKIGSSRVHTYEANPAMIPVIEETFALNGVSPRLSNCILGSAPGVETFFVTREFWSSSTVRRHRRAKAVQVRRCDVAEAMAAIRPTFLIVDIEGGEWDLFREIDLAGVRKIGIELHERVIGKDKVDATRRRIEAAGFRAVPEACTGPEQLFYALDDGS